MVSATVMKYTGGCSSTGSIVDISFGSLSVCIYLFKVPFLKKGSFLLSPDGFHGDVYLTVKLLLPGVIKSVYNLNDKQIVKLFSRIFNCNPDDMARDLEQVRGRGG